MRIDVTISLDDLAPAVRPVTRSPSATNPLRCVQFVYLDTYSSLLASQPGPFRVLAAALLQAADQLEAAQRETVDAVPA